MICAVVSVVIDWRAESAAGAGAARASSGARARAERRVTTTRRWEHWC